MSGESGNVSIVTGAAGGMGAVIAAAFARQGRPLILTDLHASALEAVAADLREHTQVQIVAGDITDPAYADGIVQSLGGRRIAALVHAAGISPSMGDGRRIFAINFTATKTLVERLLPMMAPDGVAVLIASNSGQMLARPMIDKAVRKLIAGKRSTIAALLLRSPRSAYPLSKRAVQLYAQHVSPAFGKVGARIMSLSPGIIDTAMGRLENDAGPEMQRMIDATPLGRRGRAGEIASVVSFLVSPDASYISGTDILVDGGTIAGVTSAGGMAKLMK